MSQDKPLDKSRRVIIGTTCAVGGVAAVGVGGAFLSSLAPSERAKAAGAPVRVDLNGLQAGQVKVVEWRGKPVWILKRDEKMLATLSQHENQLADPNSLREAGTRTPAYANNRNRSIKPEYLVAVGICPHLGCSPTSRLTAGPQANLPDDWPGGFLCPCHGSTFDFAGRVFKNKPSPDNLPIPPHMYLDDMTVLIGEDTPTKNA